MSDLSVLVQAFEGPQPPLPKDWKCIICFDDHTDETHGKPVAVCSYGHDFHKICAVHLIEKNEAQTTRCPLCKEMICSFDGQPLASLAAWEKYVWDVEAECAVDPNGPTWKKPFAGPDSLWRDYAPPGVTHGPRRRSDMAAEAHHHHTRALHRTPDNHQSPGLNRTPPDNAHQGHLTHHTQALLRTPDNHQSPALHHTTLEHHAHQDLLTQPSPTGMTPHSRLARMHSEFQEDLEHQRSGQLVPSSPHNPADDVQNNHNMDPNHYGGFLRGPDHVYYGPAAPPENRWSSSPPPGDEDSNDDENPVENVSRPSRAERNRCDDRDRSRSPRRGENGNAPSGGRRGGASFRGGFAGFASAAPAFGTPQPGTNNTRITAEQYTLNAAPVTNNHTTHNLINPNYSTFNTFGGNVAQPTAGGNAFFFGGGQPTGDIQRLLPLVLGQAQAQSQAGNAPGGTPDGGSHPGSQNGN